MTSIGRRPGSALYEILERAADPGATLNRFKLYGKDVSGVTQAFIQVSDGTVHQITPAPGSPIFYWGNDSVAAAADTRYMTPGFTNQIALGTPNGSFRAPRAGTLRNFRVRHNAAVGNGNSVIYDFEINTVAQGLGLSLASGAIGDASDLVTTIAVAAGDLIDLTATKALSIGAGGVNTAFVCQFV